MDKPARHTVRWLVRTVQQRTGTTTRIVMPKKDNQKVPTNTPISPKPLQPTAVSAAQAFIGPSPAECGMSLGEALNGLKYLADRLVLCTRCGYELGINENQYNRHCDGCKAENMNYAPTKKVTDFDRVLSKRIREFVGHFLGGGKGS